MEALTKNLLVSSALFEEMGFKYVGPIDGHDLPSLIENLEKVRDLNGRPVVVHVITEKGHGCSYAISSPEKFHGVPAFDPETGVILPPPKNTKSFSSAFGESLLRLAEDHPEVVALTAAMAGGTGLSRFAERFPDRFYDVGIAEEHAVVFAGGLAAGGLRPVVAIYSTFMQRALDCIFHDICLQNRPVIFCVDRAGAVEDGPTHHGIYDLSFLLGMHNLAILCPRDATELDQMLQAHTGIPEDRSCSAIRAPTGRIWNFPARHYAGERRKRCWREPMSPSGRWGRELSTAIAAAARLRTKNISASVTNTRFLKPFDEEKLLADARTRLIVTIEDSRDADGIGRIVDRLLLNSPNCGALHFSWPKEVLPHGSVPLLRERCGLLPEQIAQRIAERSEQENAVMRKLLHVC